MKRIYLFFILFFFLLLGRQAMAQPTTSGLKLWLRADDIALPDNSLVSTWSDASGLSNNFSGAGATRPTFKTNGCPDILNGKPYIHFDASIYLSRNDVLGIAANSPRTFIGVYKLTNAGIRGFVIEEGDFTSPGTYFGLDANTFNTSGNRFGVYSTNSSFDSNVATDTEYHIQFLQASTMGVGVNIISDVSYRIDDSPTTLTLKAGSGTYQSFAAANEIRLWGLMDMAEIIVYDRVLTNSERADIVTYLQAKYSFTPAPPPPTITSFTPSFGPVGTPVTITGTNFSATPTNNTVKFNGTTATVTASTATSITTTVPIGATSGPVQVGVGCNTVTGSSFIVPHHMITNFAPASGPIGTSVTINGTDFSTTPANNIVYFGATAAIVTAATSTQLTVTVPIGATFQPISVLVNGLTVYSSQPFVVTFPNGGLINTCSFASGDTFGSGATNGLGLALGDIDGDGKTDVAITDNAGLVQVFRNTSTNGSIDATSFASGVDFATGNSPEGVALADIDGDGKLDMVVASSGSDIMSIFRNVSTVGSITAASFSARVDFATGVVPRRVSCLDLDGDGKTDIAVSNNNNSSTSIWKNIGTPGVIDSGTLAPRFDLAPGGSALAIADVDLDGKPDLLACQGLGTNLIVFRNISTPGVLTAASFAPSVSFLVDAWPENIAVGDLDSDNKPDIVTSSWPANTISILKNTSTPGTIDAGSFAPQLSITGNGEPRGVVITDLDGDGYPDIGLNNQTNNLAIYKNANTPGSITSSTFLPKVIFPGMGNARSILSGDIDGDGRPEVIGSNFGDPPLVVLRNEVLNSPTITSFTPSSGTIGTTVTISGTNFSPTLSNNVVKFNGTSGFVIGVTPTTLTVVVPSGATTGLINVAVNCNSVNSASNFIVLPLSYNTCGNIGLTPGDYIKVIRNATIEPASLTIEALVNFTAIPGFGVIAAKTFGGVNQDSYAIWYEAGSLQAGVNLGGGIGTAWTPVLGQWYHIALTYNSATQVEKLYVDGGVVATGTASPPTYDNHDLLFGADVNFGTTDGFFNGKLDEIRFWNVERTQVEILTNLTGSFTGNEPGLVLYHKINEIGQGAGITVLNSTTSTSTTNNGLTVGSASTPVFQSCSSIPTITSFTPTQGPIGTEVVITGTGFDPILVNNIVKFFGTTATVISSTSTSIIAKVPVGAATGIISVTVAGNTGFSIAPFTVLGGPIIDNKIFYSRDDRTIWATSGNGSADQYITNGYFPKVSKDGRYVFFLRGSNALVSQNNIYTLDLLTGVETLVFTNNDYVVSYSWSPDVDKIVFDYGCSIWTMNRDGSAVTSIQNVDCYDDAPSANISDGRIVFHNAFSGILTINADGSSRQILPNTSPGDFWPSWSRDGQWISFSRYNAAGTTFIAQFKIKPDGSSLTQLTNLASGDNLNYGHTWSNDGLSLFMSGQIGCLPGIFQIPTDGSQIINRISDSFPIAVPDFVGGVIGTPPLSFLPLSNAPTITSLSPTSGPVGMSITITGTNFSTVPANNNVKFNGTTAVVSASTSTTINVTVPVGATTGLITVTIGCSTATSSGNFTITVPVITITLQPADFIACEGSVATFSCAATGTTNITYQWQFSPDGIVPFVDIVNGGGYSNAMTTVLSVNTTGNFGAGRYRCKIDGDFAATVFTFDEGLFINPVPADPTTTNASSCVAASLMLTASGTTNGNYRWYTVPAGGTALAGEVNSGYMTPILSATNTYYASISISNCESSRVPAIATVTIVPQPTVITSNCTATAATLSGPGGFTTYAWSNGAATQQISASTAGTYTLIVTNSGGCISPASNPITFTSSFCNQPPAIATTSATTVVEGSVSIGLSSLLSDPDNNLDISTLKIFKQPISGAVAVISSNATLNLDYTGKSFSGRDELTIEVCDLSGFCAQQVIFVEVAGEIIVYSGISPNGNGQNDTWIIQYIELLPETKSNTVSVFNRWGDEVFATANYDNSNRVFRGVNKNGDELPTGTYFYKIEFTSGKKTVTGYLSLKR